MKYLVICIGNEQNGDDGVGPYIAKELRSKREDMEVVDCGTTPENYLGIIRRFKPEKLIIVDAVEMGLEPGEIRIIPKELTGSCCISTHNIPISTLIIYLENYVRDITFIGIQPKKLHGRMSAVVKSQANKLIYLLMREDLSKIDQIIPSYPPIFNVGSPNKINC